MRSKFKMKTKWNQMIRKKLNTKINIQKIKKKQNRWKLKNKDHVVFTKQMKGSSCTLSKRDEREGGGGEKNLLKPHYSFLVVMHTTSWKISMHCFKRCHEMWCLTGEEPARAAQKDTGFSHRTCQQSFFKIYFICQKI